MTPRCWRDDPCPTSSPSATARSSTLALASACRGATSARPVTTRIGLLRHDRAVAVPFDLSIVNLLDDPTVEGLVISGHDATAQMSAERDLSEALSRLTATLDSTADGILVVDTAGKITDFNRRFAEIWGFPHNAVARQDDLSTLAFALDQLTDPDAFAVQAGGARPASPTARASTSSNSRTAAWSSGTQGPNASTGRSWDGSTAFETSPTASSWKTSSPTGPFMTR